MNTQILLLPIISFLFTLFNIPGLRIIAHYIGLVDKPNHRKVHLNPIPLVGGVSIFISTLLTIFMTMAPSDLKSYYSMFIGTSILHVMGVIDDRFDLRASIKLIIQILLAHYIFTQGIKIESLHGLFGIYELPVLIQYLLTIIIITGVVNAFNLMDGIDGLAAGLSIVSFIMFAIVSYILGNEIFVLIFTTLSGATMAFLFYNLGKNRKVFMGDAGSLMIGFVLAVSGIQLLQSKHNDVYMPQVMLGVIFVFIIPVLDALRVFRKRIKSGKSPFSADRSHLHHLFLSTGLKHKKAAAMIVLLMIAIIMIGYITFSLAGLTISLVLTILIFMSISYALQLNDQITHWKKKIKDLEKNDLNIIQP